MALLRAIATVGGWTMGSRILGFVRDILIANVLGAGMVSDAFFVAFKFPNFFRRLFAEGAFNAAFVPLFGRRLHESGLAEARLFAGDVASVLIAWLLLFTAAIMATMPWVMVAIAPGFVDEPEKFALTVDLARIAFPYLLFMALTALLSGVLNSLERFAAAAAAPILLNVVLITTLLLVLSGVVEHAGFALAWGVCAGGVAQFLLLAVATDRAGALFSLPRPRLTPGVKRVLALMGPGIVGAGVVQINLVIGMILATQVGEGAVSYLYYADRVNQLPLGVVGVAVGIALLPLLTRQLRTGAENAASDSQNRAIEFALLLTVPATVALIAIPGPIVSVLYQHGRFDAETAAATAAALRAFALGLPAYVLIKALTPGFFAREDTATPVKIAAVAMIANVVLAYALMQVMAHVGIALATAIAAWGNAIGLGVVLHRRGHLRIDQRLRNRTPRTLLASAAMGGLLWAAALWLDPLLVGPLLERVAALGLLVGGGLAAFAALAQITGAGRFGEIKTMLRRGAS